MIQKKLLSGLLATLFLIGTLSVSALAFTDDDQIAHQDAVSAVVEAGIMNGRNTGDFDPKANVTRAEMAKMITILIQEGHDPVLTVPETPAFSDTAGHWAAGYIEYLTQFKNAAGSAVITGMGDGTFAPENHVTYAQALKMLLVTLGYNAEASGFSGSDQWMLNISTKAEEHQLLAGFTSANYEAALTREEAAVLIYNTMNATPLPVGSEADDLLPDAVLVQVGQLYQTFWGEVTFTATNVATEYKGQSAGSGSTFVIVTIAQKNTWSAEDVLMMSTMDFTLVPDNNTDLAVGSEVPWDDAMMLGLFYLDPGASATYDLVFKVPAATAAAKLYYGYDFLASGDNGMLRLDIAIK